MADSSSSSIHSNNDKEDDTTSCSVCLERYAEAGDHIPRILPCYHTVCHSCIGVLLQDQVLQGQFLLCPECRHLHMVAGNGGILTFPQNKYILTMIRKKAEELENKRREKIDNHCLKHEKELCFYCKDSACKRSLCSQCFLEGHRFHDVVDLQTERVEKRQFLMSNLDLLNDTLKRNKEKLLVKKVDMDRKFKTCVSKIEATRDSQIRMLTRIYDKRIKEAREQLEAVNSGIDNDVTAIDENIYLLETMRGCTNEKNTNLEEILNRIDAIRNVHHQVNSTLTGKRIYQYSACEGQQITTDDALKWCNTLTVSETSLELLKMGDLDNGAAEFQGPVKKKMRVSRNDVSKYTVKFSIRTTYSHISFMSLFGGGSVVVLGKEAESGQCKLIQYNLNIGDVICNRDVDEEPDGMTDIVFNGKPCLALAYRSKGRIDFCDASDLRTVVFSHTVAPHQPGTLARCSASDSILLYVDDSRGDVWCLDCSTATPETWSNVIITQQEGIPHMCCLADGDKHLLITTHGTSVIHAYNTKTDELEWRLKGKLEGMARNSGYEGITADGDGHLFICDRHNASIQMFSSSGEHLEVVMGKRQKLLGIPMKIRHSREMSSLVVAHIQQRMWCIDVIGQ